jgi:L-lysine exporter family protein LysE/ArgO
LYFLQGLLLGFAYVAPIGLQNIFIINMALTQSRGRAMATAFVTIFFDVSLALACFFGIGALMEQFAWLKMCILGVGSILVIIIGAKLIMTKKKPENLDETHPTDLPFTKIVATSCLFTWFNPQALLDGTMMLGAFKATLPAGEASLFIIGIVFSSFCWFLGLTFFARIFSDRLTEKTLRVINIICGIVIILYGGVLAAQFVQAIL